MKNKKLIILILVIIGVIIGTVALGIYAFKYLVRTGVEEIKNVEQELAEEENQPVKIEKIIDIGLPAPEFTLEDLEGNEISLKDFQGEKNVLLNFWASWCPPCRMEMPDLDRLYIDYKDDDFVVLAVNLGEDKDTVKEFIEEKGYSFPVVLDKTQEVGIIYQTFSIPTSVMVDKEGIIRAYRPGLMTYEEMLEFKGSVE